MWSLGQSAVKRLDHTISPDDCVLLQSPLFPLYDRLTADNLASSLTMLFKELDQSISQLEASQFTSWQATVDPFERINDRMNVAWGVVEHLQASAVDNTFCLLAVPVWSS